MSPPFDMNLDIRSTRLGFCAPSKEQEMFTFLTDSIQSQKGTGY